MQWFRLYSETLNDPKVQSLDGETFKAWINLLCVASMCNASCNVTDVSFHLRCSNEIADSYVKKLIAAGLFHQHDGIITPHGWHRRQYKSDTSTDRVKKYRQGKKSTKPNVSETFHETPPEQIQNKTEQKQKNKGDKSIPLPDWLPKEEWEQYLEMRKKKGKAATNYAKQLVIIKLDELRKKGHDPGECLKESIINGWTSVFEKKEKWNANTKPNAHDNFTAGIVMALDELSKQQQR